MVIDTTILRTRRQQRRRGFYIPSPTSSTTPSPPLLVEEDHYDDDDLAVFDARVEEKRMSFECNVEDDDEYAESSTFFKDDDDYLKKIMIRNAHDDEHSVGYDSNNDACVQNNHGATTNNTISVKTTIEFDEDGNVNVILVDETQRDSIILNRVIQMSFENDEIRSEDHDHDYDIYDTTKKGDGDNETNATASTSTTSNDDDTITTIEERTLLERALLQNAFLESALLESALKHLEIEEEREVFESEQNDIRGVIVEQISTPELSSKVVEGIILSNSPEGNEIILNRCW